MYKMCVILIQFQILSTTKINKQLLAVQWGLHIRNEDNIRNENYNGLSCTNFEINFAVFFIVLLFCKLLEWLLYDKTEYKYI